MNADTEKAWCGTHTPATSARKGERGSVLAYTVVSVLFLFMAVGLGVDLSHMYLVKTELQNAADAAALAGASALLLPDDQDPIGTAVDRAVSVMNQNKYNFNQQEFADVMPVDEQRDLVEFAVNLDGTYYKEGAVPDPSKIRFVRVLTPSVPINIYFALPILGATRNLTARATSGLSVPSNVFCNFVPIAVVEGVSGGGIGWLDANGDGTRDYATDCNPPPGSPNCDPNTKFCPGCKYKMVAGPGNWQATSPGNYQALDAGSGAKDLKLAIAGGTTNCLTSNDNAEFITETEPGRMTGPIAKGLNTRFDIYKSADCPPGVKCTGSFGSPNVTIGGVTKTIHEAFPPDPNIYSGPAPPKKPPAGWAYAGINYNQYTNAVNPSLNWKSPTHTWAPNRREVLLPIINKAEFQPGKDEVKFTKVGKFFLNKLVDEGNNEIYVEFLEPALGAGGYDPAGGNTAPVVVPVLYR